MSNGQGILGWRWPSDSVADHFACLVCVEFDPGLFTRHDYAHLWREIHGLGLRAYIDHGQSLIVQSNIVSCN